MASTVYPDEDEQSRAMAAAEITGPALERDLPHLALGAAREAVRSALLALAAVPRRPPGPDLGLLRDMAAAPPQHLAGLTMARTAKVRATLAVMERLFARVPPVAWGDLPDGGGGRLPPQ
jgi:hypothetical protein